MGPKSRGVGYDSGFESCLDLGSSPLPSYSRVCESPVQGYDSVAPWMGWRGTCSAEKHALGRVSCKLHICSCIWT